MLTSVATCNYVCAVNIYLIDYKMNIYLFLLELEGN